MSHALYLYGRECGSFSIFHPLPKRLPGGQVKKKKRDENNNGSVIKSGNLSPSKSVLIYISGHIFQSTPRHPEENP